MGALSLTLDETTGFVGQVAKPKVTSVRTDKAEARPHGLRSHSDHMLDESEPTMFFFSPFHHVVQAHIASPRKKKKRR